MVMRTMILFIALITMPFLSNAQVEKKAQDIQTVSSIETVSEVSIVNLDVNLKLDSEFITYKKVERISKDPMIQNRMINAQKSGDLISVKAYIKSLQMKRKETLMS